MKHGPPTFARLFAWSVLLLGLSVGCGAGCGADPVPPPATREMPDADRSAVEASKAQAIRANGKDIVDIKVTVRKADGTALEGRTVKVTVSGEGNTVQQPAGTTDAQGVAIAKVSSTVAGIKTVTASVESEGGPVTLTSRPSLEFIVLPASKLAFTQAPTSGTAGAALGAFEVTIQNGDGETVTSATNTVTVVLGSGPAAAALEGTVSVAAVNGVARFPELVLKKAASGYTLVASGAGLTGATSQSFDVVPAAPASLAVAQVADIVTAGHALSPEVSVLDAFGNVVTGYTGTMRFSSTDGSATLPADYAFTAADAGRHVFTGGLVLKQAGSRQVTVKDTADAALVTTREVGVVPGAAAKLVFTEQPADRFVRQAFGVQVALTDAFGNRVAANAPAVSLGLNKATGTLAGLAPVVPVDGVASFPGLSIAEDDAGYVLTASGTGLTPASSNAFTITDNVAPAEPDLTLTVNGIDSITVGWKAVGDDGLFGQASSYEFLYSTDPDFIGALPVSLGTPKPANELESVTLPGLIPGTTYYVALKVMDNVNNAARATRSASTPYPEASKLVFLEQPRNGRAGSALSPDVKVAIQDSAGRTVGNANFAVTLTVKGVSGFGPFTVNADKGVATFTGANAVRIDKAGTNYSLEATASTTSGTALTPATSNFFDIDHAPASRLVLSGPSSVVATTKNSVTVKVLDAYDNPAVGFTGTVSLASSDTAATLPAPHVFTAADNAQHTFADVILNTPDPRTTLTASDGAGLTSNTLEVEVTPVPPGKLVLTGLPATVKAGETVMVTVEAFDGLDRRDTGYTGTVRFTSTDGKATLPGEYTFSAAADMGIKTFPVTLVTARELAHSVTVEDKALPTFTSTASTTVTWAELARFVMDAPASAKAGDPFTAQVTALDAHGNVVEDYLGTVSFSSDPAGATVPADSAFTPDDKGSAVFTFTVKKAESTTLTVTDPLLGKSGSDTVVVSPASTMHLVMVVTPSGPVTAGTELTVEVTAKDDFGNVATGYTGTVHFASSDLKAALPGDTAFGTGDAGHKSFFPVVLKTARAEDQTLSVKDVDSPSLAAETSLRVDVGPAAKLAFRDQPRSSTQVRASLGTVSVAVTDLFDNVVDTSSPEISLALVGGNAAAVLSGMVPTSPSGGIATFSGLSVDQQGSGFQLQATGGTYTVSSAAFTIVDDIAPSAPSLSEVSKTSIRVELQWNVVGDDAMAGAATSYELRYATSPIDDSTFAAASNKDVAVSPESGAMMSGIITGLSPETTYHFALRVKDDVGNASVLSVLSVTTKANPCTPGFCTAAPDTCAADGVSLTTYTSTCVDVDNTPTCQEAQKTTACPGTNAVCFMNACDTAAKPGANALSVSEVMHTSSSVATTEYVELTNNTDKLLNLNGLEVSFRSSAGTTLGTFTVGSGSVPVIINRKGPKGTFVLAQNKDKATNGGVSADFAYGSAIDLDKSGQIQLISGSTVVEDFTYTTSFPQRTGYSMNLSSLVVGTRANSRSWYWCESEPTALLSGSDYGTPNAPNSSCGIAPSAPMDFCAIQPPPSGSYPSSILPGTSFTVYSQFQEPGVTDRNTKGNDNYPHVFAELGYGKDATKPETWTWTSANPNASYSSDPSINDEVQGTLSLSSEGTFHYGFRYRILDPFTGTSSPYTYCDQSGVVTPPAGTYGTVTVAAPVLTNHLVISEFSPVGPNGADDEFIEIHNPTRAEVDIGGWKLQYKGATAGSYNTGGHVFPPGTKIAARGYYLLRYTSYSGSVPADATYPASLAMGGTAGHVRLSMADGTVVDTVGYGSTANAAEGSPITATRGASGSYERKAYAASTAGTMEGGADANRGNGTDTENNASDFVVRTTRQPQNAASATEFP